MPSGPGAIRIESGAAAAVISPQATSFEETIPPDEIADWPARDAAAQAEDSIPLESSEADPIAAGALWPPVRRPPVAVPPLSPSSALPPVAAPPVPRARGGAAVPRRQRRAPPPRTTWTRRWAVAD